MSTLGNAIAFLQDFGLFDVILPFLLVFTLVFAVLEKTKIFGMEGTHSRKNLNAMVAFSIAFFVTASVNIVTAFQVALPWVSLVLVILVSFLLLSGVMFEETSTKNIWSLFGADTKLTKWLIGIVGVVVLIIFANAFGVLDYLYGFFQGGDNSTLVTSLIFLLLLVAAMWYAIGPKGTTTPPAARGT